MIIKKCTEEDIARVGEFYDRNVAHMIETGTNYPIWRYKDYPSTGTVEENVKEGYQYCCVQDDNVCGAFVLNDNPGGAYNKAKWQVDLSEGEYLVLHTLCIDFKESGKGLGVQCVGFTIDYARGRGYRAVRLDIVPTNIPAIKLYEKCGFKLTDTLDLERNIAGIPEFVVMEFVI